MEMRKPSARDFPGLCARYNVKLSPYTTWNVGGVSKILFTPFKRADLIAVMKWIGDNGMNFYLLGGGSNVLITDDVLETPVVLTTGMTGISARLESGVVFLDCLAGTSLKEVLSLSVKNGWSGLEFAAGIPGTVGGATAGNAGAVRGSIGSVVESVTAVERDGSVVKWNASEITWDYRSCSLFEKTDRVAHSVTFRLHRSELGKVAYSVKAAMEDRKTQPSVSRTAGCVFRNPSGDSAGRLLDAAGCKGMRVGGARVSASHANFIENIGECTARDILSLALACKKMVQDAFGTLLRFEIKTIGIEDVWNAPI
ncbi:MAG: UDP-N-acetylmuramate dehydrogenase [Synergistaceae bacterium]|jgi:UDP-N-acetylmuramate dehydrogenase|nr:UDP-N-acetylmuramate dehydrogenase [Synergistaceae bacterium]